MARGHHLNPYSTPMSGVTRSVKPLLPAVKRRLKSISTRPPTFALHPIDALDAEYDEVPKIMSSNPTGDPAGVNVCTLTRGESIA